jgi:hypothetical protein
MDRNRAYYERNADKERARVRAYHALNRDKRLAVMNAYHRSPVGLFRRGVLHAKRHGYVWSISAEQFSALRAKPCHYCDGPLPQTGHGLDRIDCSRGYEPDNVLPCCQSCNRKRSNDWTVEETRLAVQAVLAHRRARHG